MFIIVVIIIIIVIVAIYNKNKKKRNLYNSKTNEFSTQPEFDATNIHITNTINDYAKSHYELILLIQSSYINNDYNKCEKYCVEDISIFPHYIYELGREHNFNPKENVPLSLVSFETLAKIYEK